MTFISHFISRIQYRGQVRGEGIHWEKKYLEVGNKDHLPQDPSL